MVISMTPLEIILHLNDGSVLKYVQDQADIIHATLKKFEPHKVFADPQIIIAGRYTITGYRSSAVARIDLVMEGLPPWPFGHDITHMAEIGEDDFKREIESGEDGSRTRERKWRAGDSYHEFAEVELANGTSVYLEIRATYGPTFEQRSVIHKFIAGSGVYCLRHGGGAVFLNPVNIARWTLFPGPPEAPKDALKAHFILKQSGKSRLGQVCTASARE